MFTLLNVVGVVVLATLVSVFAYDQWRIWRTETQWRRAPKPHEQSKS